jgi:hypothetical protein
MHYKKRLHSSAAFSVIRFILIQEILIIVKKRPEKII